MRKFAVVSAILAGLLLTGCASNNSALDDGWKLIQSQDYAAAQAQYQAVLAENPNNPYANLNLGVAYEKLGDKASAAKYYQAAIANGKDAHIVAVAEDGKVAERSTTVSKVAEENLAGLAS